MSDHAPTQHEPRFLTREHRIGCDALSCVEKPQQSLGMALLWGWVVIATCTTSEGPYPSCLLRPPADIPVRGPFFLRGGRIAHARQYPL
jgi:hypothetical protein